MHLKIWINSNHSKILRLPLSNLHLFQSFLYKLLPSTHASFLHDKGYIVDGRPMKLFAMSWPIADKYPKIGSSSIELDFPVLLVVSTPVADTLDGITRGALLDENLRIGNNLVVCKEVEAKNILVSSEKITLQTLSPITCYSQMLRCDGRKYTVYFSPQENNFSESVHNNLVRKFKAIYPDKELPKGKVVIAPAGRIKEQVAKFSDKNSFPIKGWSGKFFLTGPKALLQIGVDCGLGAKNSSGFGCVIISEKILN